MSDDLLMKKCVISITFAELILQKLINRVQRNEDRGPSLECYNTFPRQEKRKRRMWNYASLFSFAFAEVLKMVGFLTFKHPMLFGIAILTTL